MIVFDWTLLYWIAGLLLTMIQLVPALQLALHFSEIAIFASSQDRRRRQNKEESCDGKIKNGNPLRISGWEIHPIYTFEVCKFADIKKCSSNSKTAWQPLSRADGIDIGDDEQNP